MEKPLEEPIATKKSLVICRISRSQRSKLRAGRYPVLANYHPAQEVMAALLLAPRRMIQRDEFESEVSCAE